VKRVAILVALLACGKRNNDAVGSGSAVASRAFADVQVPVLDGWTAKYEESSDSWLLTGPATVRLERADERYVAGPDAYMNHLSPRWKGRLVTIEDRGNTRSSGFAMKLGVYTGENDPKPLHVTVLVGKLGRVWFRCLGEGIEDDAIHQQVIEMCKAVRM
jgi:hypothetical protein